MTLEEYCNTLNDSKLASITIELCEVAMMNWEKYCKKNKTEYKDSVAGINHQVRPELLRETIYEVRRIQKSDNRNKDGKFDNIYKLMNEYVEPVIALQDWDWVLPNETEKAFYAVYNLLNGCINKVNDSDALIHYIAINQAIEAIEEGNLLNEKEIRKIIYEGL